MTGKKLSIIVFVIIFMLASGALSWVFQKNLIWGMVNFGIIEVIVFVVAKVLVWLVDLFFPKRVNENQEQ